jgi:hypothetical protein
MHEFFSLTQNIVLFSETFFMQNKHLGEILGHVYLENRMNPFPGSPRLENLLEAPFLTQKNELSE